MRVNVWFIFSATHTRAHRSCRTAACCVCAPSSWIYIQWPEKACDVGWHNRVEAKIDFVSQFSSHLLPRNKILTHRFFVLPLCTPLFPRCQNIGHIKIWSGSVACTQLRQPIVNMSQIDAVPHAANLCRRTVETSEWNICSSLLDEINSHGICQIRN